jgi:hypothetical protein
VGQRVEMVERNWNGQCRGRRSTQAGMMCDGRERDGRAIFTGTGPCGNGRPAHHDSTPRSSEVTRYTTPARSKARSKTNAIAWRIPRGRCTNAADVYMRPGPATCCVCSTLWGMRVANSRTLGVGWSLVRMAPDLMRNSAPWNAKNNDTSRGGKRTPTCPTAPQPNQTQRRPPARLLLATPRRRQPACL